MGGIRVGSVERLELAEDGQADAVDVFIEVDDDLVLRRDAVARLAAWGGRVRFAGAELDDLFSGYVEGAIHSGRTAVARITGDAAANIVRASA